MTTPGINAPATNHEIMPHSVWRRQTIRYAYQFRSELTQAVEGVLGNPWTPFQSPKKVQPESLHAESPVVLKGKSSSSLGLTWSVASSQSVRSAETPALEPLLQLDCYKQAAMIIHEAMSLRAFKGIPDSVACWNAYRVFHNIEPWASSSLWILLVLNIFETPLWCHDKPLEDPGVCAAGNSSDYFFSGVPYLPVSLAVSLEYIILGLLLARFVAHARVSSLLRAHGHKTSKEVLVVEAVLIAASFVDTSVYVSKLWTNNRVYFRLAPFLRLGLAAISLEEVRMNLDTFYRSVLAIRHVAMLFGYTVILFAFVSSSFLDDINHLNEFGDPVNTGFETFSDAVYTCFATLTTAALPDSIMPSYTESRGYILLWLPFIFVGAVLLKQVILSAVYTDYARNAKRRLSEGQANRKYGIDVAFDLMKSDGLIIKDGKQISAVRWSDFEQIVDVLGGLTRISVDKAFLHVLFEALDDDENGVLSADEFEEFCDVLQFEFYITKRDSYFRRCVAGTCLERFLTSWTENWRSDTNLGYHSRYPGSMLDIVMNVILALNACFVVLEVFYDMKKLEEPSWFLHADIFFSFVYLLESATKLLNWSFAEYWHYTENRFDFVTSIVLAVAGVAFVKLHMSSDLLRNVNSLRLLRLLKAIKHVRTYQRACAVVSQTLASCRDVMQLNAIVVLMWSVAGVQLLGGALVESNPRLQGKNLDYFGSKYQAFNFNDVPSGMITLFMWTLGDWNEPLAAACVETAEPESLHRAAIWLFLISYYVASPLLSYNVFSAFSIDVYGTVDSLVQKEEDEGRSCEVERNLIKIQGDMAQQGLVLHIQESAELSKLHVHSAVFDT